MIDQHLRPFYQRVCVDPFVQHAYMKGIHPITLTLLGCLFGLLSMPFIIFGYVYLAFICLLISGFLDTLDGSVARYFKLTSPQGTVLDIVCDRFVEFVVILGLYGVDPIARGLGAILMLGSILLCVTTFLVVGIFTPNQRQKGFYYSSGLMERAEAFICFSLMILFPSTFVIVATLFVILTSWTAFLRCWQFLTQQTKEKNY